ncbi:hypothetical protein [Terrisporobacter vanillatitrophus]|uniref:hypothetical protein n=1 Tax=Terrisporobacter vanillatitrophus TaxID=3058402 RepID=UPI0033669710
MSILNERIIRRIIADESLSSQGDIGNYLKDMFKDVIQEMVATEPLSVSKFHPGVKFLTFYVKNMLYL